MFEFLSITSYLAASQLLLTGLFYFVNFRRTRLGLLITVLCFCLLAAVVPTPIGFEAPLLSYLQGRLGGATPAVLWLLAHALFVDDRRVSPLAWLFLIGYQIARGIAVYADDVLGAIGTWITALTIIGLLIAFGLAVHVIVMATKELRHDLLEQRRRIRGPFAAGLGLVMALGVAAILAPEFMSEESAAVVGQAVITIAWLLLFIFFLAFNLLSFRLVPDSQIIVDSAEPDARPKSNSQLQLDESDIELMRKLDRQMLEEKYFTEPELTIGQLATLLSVQEYKLRVIINRELGYKNFNQFLNHYRINEACLLLEQKSNYRNISIVAQDVGYSSLSPFNHAFKKLKGVTPSQFKSSLAPEKD